MVDETYYAQYQIREIENCIEKLEQQKKELIKNIERR